MVQGVSLTADFEYPCLAQEPQKLFCTDFMFPELRTTRRLFHYRITQFSTLTTFNETNPVAKVHQDAKSKSIWDTTGVCHFERGVTVDLVSKCCNILNNML